MFGTEWPLVIFTILVQMSVGLLIVSELACLTGGAAARDLLKAREFSASCWGWPACSFPSVIWARPRTARSRSSTWRIPG